MQVSVESTSALERRMTVGVPVERIETEVNKRLQQTARRAKVPGFRPGKVPMSVIRQRYEDAARQEVLGDLIQATFYEAVVEQKLSPGGAQWPDLGAGARYTGPKPGDAANSFEVPGFVVYDTTVSYDLSKVSPSLRGVETSLNVQNVFNREYVSHCNYSFGCYYGQERVASVDVTYNF